MQMFFDFLPLFVFFIAYQFFDIFIATASTMVVACAQLSYVWWKKRTIDYMLLFSAGIILVMGTLTLVLHNEIFIKWKPTLVFWLFASVFIGSEFPYFGGKSLLQKMLAPLFAQQNIHLDDASWKTLTRWWIYFYIVMGCLNLVVAYNFDTPTWVSFKVFGLMGSTILLVLFQSYYISRFNKGKNDET